MLKIVPHAGPDRRCMVYLVGVLEMPRTKTGATHSHKESRLPDKHREIKGLVFFFFSSCEILGGTNENL